MDIADIIAVKGKTWLSRAILRATKGEVSHVGLVLATRPALVIEALWRVQTVPLTKSISGNEAVYLLEAQNLSEEQRIKIAESACKWSGYTYGYGKLLLHGLDALFGTEWFSRNLSFSEWPICSELVGKAYREVGLFFGEPARTLTPQDILDFARNNPDKYRVKRIS